MDLLHLWAGTHGAHWESKIQLVTAKAAAACKYQCKSRMYIILYRCGRDYCDAKEIMSIADAMATNGMKEMGYEYINFDGKPPLL